MNKELAKKKAQLPNSIEKLQEFILIGQEKLKAYKLKLGIVKKLELAKGVRDKTLEDGQRMGEAILLAEAKLGELLPPLIDPTLSRKGRRQLPEGITHKQSHYAQELARHPDLIEQELAEAQEHEDIPTKRGVLRKIQEVTREKERKEYKEQPLPKGKFHIIYADPPWQFDNAGLEQSAESKYPTMPTDGICKLPIQELCDIKAVLFLWATNAMLEDALRVCKAWGFDYKSNRVWIKDTTAGIGWFTISKHELLLIATKGEGMHPEKKFESWFKAKVEKHSKKPELVYEQIEMMYPNMKYVELFARKTREGWQSWGNQI